MEDVVASATVSATATVSAPPPIIPARIPSASGLRCTASSTRTRSRRASSATRWTPPRPGKPKTHGLGAVKGVILGYWRDSNVPDEKDRHAVIGFIDVRDRLRTRIQVTNRSGKSMTAEWPLPPGPGGSWVTFERVVFDKHLVNLDHNQIKEYVKIRSEAIGKNETEEEARANEKLAVKEAVRRVQEHPPPEGANAPAIAYGPEIPEHATMAHKSRVQEASHRPHLVGRERNPP